MSVRSTTNTIHNVFPKCRQCCIPKKLQLNIRNVINITSCHTSHKCYMIFINWHDKFMYIMTFYQAAIITKRTYNTEPRFFVFSDPTDPTHYQVWPDSLPVHSLPFIHLSSFAICLLGMFRLVRVPFDHISS